MSVTRVALESCVNLPASDGMANKQVMRKNTLKKPSSFAFLTFRFGKLLPKQIKKANPFEIRICAL